MLFKSIRGKRKTFKPLIRYAINGAIRDKDSPTPKYEWFWNAEGDEKTITKAFIENDKYRKNKSKGNTTCLHHFVMSWSPQDNKEDAIAAANSLVMEYFNERDPGVGYSTIHEGKNGIIHAHILMSANKFRSSESVRQSRKGFLQTVTKLHELEREHFPSLKHSFRRDKRSRPEQSHMYGSGKSKYIKGMDQLRTKNQTSSLRELLDTKQNMILYLESVCHHLIKNSNNFYQFLDGLKKHGLETYTRSNGVTNGVLFGETKDGKPKKWRFETILNSKDWLDLKYYRKRYNQRELKRDRPRNRRR